MLARPSFTLKRIGCAVAGFVVLSGCVMPPQDYAIYGGGGHTHTHSSSTTVIYQGVGVDGNRCYDRDRDGWDDDRHGMRCYSSLSSGRSYPSYGYPIYGYPHYGYGYGFYRPRPPRPRHPEHVDQPDYNDPPRPPKNTTPRVYPGNETPRPGHGSVPPRREQAWDGLFPDRNRPRTSESARPIETPHPKIADLPRAERADPKPAPRNDCLSRGDCPVSRPAPKPAGPSKSGPVFTGQ